MSFEVIFALTKLQTLVIKMVLWFLKEESSLFRLMKNSLEV